MNSVLFLNLGTPAFNYKNPLDFGKLTNFDIESANEINFQVLDSEVQNYEAPFVYNNLTSPITLAYVNKAVKANYQIRNSQTSIVYDGRLLKTANVDLTKLNCGISFELIVNTINGEEYKCRIYFSIPLKLENSTILDGNILQTISLDGSGKFYQF